MDVLNSFVKNVRNTFLYPLSIMESTLQNLLEIGHQQISGYIMVI